MTYAFEGKTFIINSGKECEDTNPYGVLINSDFDESENVENQYLTTNKSINNSFIDEFDILGSIGLVTNPQPESYRKRLENLKHEPPTISIPLMIFNPISRGNSQDRFIGQS